MNIYLVTIVVNVIVDIAVVAMYIAVITNCNVNFYNVNLFFIRTNYYNLLFAL
jgi:hypothetical protein